LRIGTESAAECESKSRYSEIETADSGDFADFEEVIADEHTNLFVAKLQGIYIRNLLHPCNPRNLRLNLFRLLG
jgi:hypothetical protein